MPEISYSAFREAAIQAEVNRVAIAMTRPVVTAQSLLMRQELRKIAIQVSEEEAHQNALSKRVRIKSKCPKCGRMVQTIGGQLMSHKNREKSNGYATGDWCINGGYP